MRASIDAQGSYNTACPAIVDIATWQHVNLLGRQFWHVRPLLIFAASRFRRMLLSAGTVRRSSDLTLAGYFVATVERLVQLAKTRSLDPSTCSTP